MTSEEARERLEKMANERHEMEDFDNEAAIRQFLADHARLDADFSVESHEKVAELEVAYAAEQAKVAALEAAIASAVCEKCGHKTIHDKGVAIHWCEECVAAALKAALAEKDALIKDMGRDRERLRVAREQAQADAAAMRQAIGMLPAMQGTKTGRKDYMASVTCDVLWQCVEASKSGAGQPLLDELARLRPVFEEVKRLLYLPNLENRIGPWNDVAEALERVRDAYLAALAKQSA